MRIVAFVGFAAVGKQSTIRRILDGDAGLQERFGVSGRLYAMGYAFQPFIDWKILEADTVLVQWQPAEHDKLGTLRRFFPGRRLSSLLLAPGLGEPSEVASGEIRARMATHHRADEVAHAGDRAGLLHG
jgi:hypothetical protein